MLRLKNKYSWAKTRFKKIKIVMMNRTKIRKKQLIPIKKEAKARTRILNLIKLTFSVLTTQVRKLREKLGKLKTQRNWL